MTTTVYQTGETIRITATITDEAGVAADPTTTVISIEDPAGTLLVDGSAMTQSVSGTYYYDYLIPATIGSYKAQVTATGSGGRITIVPDRFLVAASI